MALIAHHGTPVAQLVGGWFQLFRDHQGSKECKAAMTSWGLSSWNGVLVSRKTFSMTIVHHGDIYTVTIWTFFFLLNYIYKYVYIYMCVCVRACYIYIYMKSAHHFVSTSVCWYDSLPGPCHGVLKIEDGLGPVAVGSAENQAPKTSDVTKSCTSW